MDEPELLEQRQTLGKYDVLYEIGRGSMGTVYLGYDQFRGRDVAIKVAHADSLNDPTQGSRYRKMFFNEAKIAGRLKHPNIVQVFDAGVEQDTCYIVMEYVTGGETLNEVTQPENLLPLHEVVRILFRCAKALDYAHRHGVIHRDIKPRNILVTEQKDIKIGDFSIALLYEAEATDTQVHGYVGSPLYMSPEQIKDDSITNQSDLFSLGMVAYELLTGKHPFIADSLGAIIHRITEGVQIPLQELRADVPPILAHIVDRCLQKNPASRYRNGLDIAADLSLVFDDIKLLEEDVSGQDKFNLVRDLNFFTDFTDSEIWEILNASAWHDFDVDTEIISEGEIEDAFYIIVNGAVRVMKGDMRVDVLERGDCFGEMGFIAGRQRTASIIASDQVTALKVKSSLIEQATLPCQLRFHKVFLHTLVTRLSFATERMGPGEAG